MISTIVGAYSYVDRSGVERVKLTLAQDVHDFVSFGRPCQTLGFKKENFKTSSGVPVEVNEKLIGKRFCIDVGSYNGATFGRSLDEVK